MRRLEAREMIAQWRRADRLARMPASRASRARRPARHGIARGAGQLRAASGRWGSIPHLPWFADPEHQRCRTAFWYTRFDHMVDQRIAEQRYSCELIGKSPPAYEVLLERALSATQPEAAAVTVVAGLCVAFFAAWGAPAQLLGFLSVFPALGAMRLVCTSVALRRLRRALRAVGTQPTTEDGAAAPNVL